jgi:hypothetical protein
VLLRVRHQRDGVVAVARVERAEVLAQRRRAPRRRRRGRAATSRVHVAQRVGERGVDQRDRPGDVLIRADGAQLEAIAAPRERRGAIAVLVRRW